MERAFRTSIEVINQLPVDYEPTETELQNPSGKKFKNIIRSFIYPKTGVVNGNTLQNLVFPTSDFEYDYFISHSHLNRNEAYRLAKYLEAKGYSCFVDSQAWKSADQLLKEIDDKYCYQKHSKTYSYKKRNFTTSHVHSMLAMALLDVILRSHNCIFIESKESISLRNGLNKKTFSPWLYQEIKFMQTILDCRPQRITESQVDFQCSYDMSGIDKFKFLTLVDFDNIKSRHFIQMKV